VGGNVKDTIVVRGTAKLSATAWHTSNMDYNVLHELLCSLKCVKCVCTNVQVTDICRCVVVVSVEKFECHQQPYTEGRVRLYRHLKDLHSKRAETEDANVVRTKKVWYWIFENRHVEESA